MPINVVSTVGKYEGYAFKLGVFSGTLAAGLAAASPVFAFRNILSPRKIRIIEVRASLVDTATAFAAGNGALDMVIARGWTASDTGGTQVVIAAASHTNKLRTSQVTSQLQGTNGDIRIANVGTLTAGTRTLDTNAVSAITFGVTAVAGSALLADSPVYIENVGGYTLPIVLDQNEGFILRLTQPGTGTSVLGVQVAWAEIDGGGGARS